MVEMGVAVAAEMGTSAVCHLCTMMVQVPTTITNMIPIWSMPHHRPVGCNLTQNLRLPSRMITITTMHPIMITCMITTTITIRLTSTTSPRIRMIPIRMSFTMIIHTTITMSTTHRLLLHRHHHHRHRHRRRNHHHLLRRHQSHV